MLLAAAAEAHDRTTGEHLQNVRVVSERLALELGYDEESARQIGLAAVLHDMGKIRVPDSVLANTGRLSEAEWELMKHHAVWGEQFLAGRDGLRAGGVHRPVASRAMGRRRLSRRPGRAKKYRSRRQSSPSPTASMP